MSNKINGRGFLRRHSWPAGGWRCFYKRLLQMRSGDLQLRIVHGAIASNVHVAHFDSGRNTECPFCGGMETVAHIFAEC